MTIVDVVVLTLAVWEAVEIYHHSSLFASCRAWFEVVEGRLAELAGCPFCLSPWVATALVLWYLLAAWAGAWAPLLRLPIYALAMARGANVLNDATHSWCRTPGSGERGFPDPDEGDQPAEGIDGSSVDANS